MNRLSKTVLASIVVPYLMIHSSIAIGQVPSISPPTDNTADKGGTKVFPVRIENGDMAKPIEISQWSDGDRHSLNDLKGKTVVLHFWGTWCGPCIATIPVWKRLEEKYSREEVVFIGIHTAGTGMDDVRAFMKKHNWEHLTGIDEGVAIADSVTFRRYGISAVNQIVVVNAEGAVTYNGGKPTQSAGPVEIARQLGVKGPGEESTEQEAQDGGIAIMTHMYDKEIEAALRSAKIGN
ncbi:TlpA disulfide reductase family protein [Novipirellula artificiosorum]|uniref:Thiol-disulfide oxidoreductase ResA n=1 Tax=Novipirellula artificiosorum TaxID=2528016 RepID=A0A5C6DXH7_9BACT|nr:TlpA disulfide reductase family protein [Novipirellula artificiosorum]TWU39529.1 Thiol-disulfide oxidoreductase ResA [Novipirellula artificiosorum]